MDWWLCCRLGVVWDSICFQVHIVLSLSLSDRAITRWQYCFLLITRNVDFWLQFQILYHQRRRSAISWFCPNCCHKIPSPHNLIDCLIYVILKLRWTKSAFLWVEKVINRGNCLFPNVITHWKQLSINFLASTCCHWAASTHWLSEIVLKLKIISLITCTSTYLSELNKRF